LRRPHAQTSHSGVQERRHVLRTLIMSAVAAVFTLSIAAFAQQGQFANAAEAKAMLERAIAAVKVDKTKALEMFDKGEGGFMDRDIFPFCFNYSDGKVVATPFKNLLGIEMRGLKDPNGEPYGQELLDAAKEGQVNEVSYMFPRPGADQTLVPKVAFVARVGDLGCAVGYYK
jgi:signal transduction histidine kinase